MLFDDAKRILHEKRELLLSSERSMRIVLIFLDSEAEDQLAVAVQDMILLLLPSEEDATSLSDSRFKLKRIEGEQHRREILFSWAPSFH